jgi:hypothetical protein
MTEAARANHGTWRSSENEGKQQRIAGTIAASVLLFFPLISSAVDFDSVIRLCFHQFIFNAASLDNPAQAHSIRTEGLGCE